MSSSMQMPARAELVSDSTGLAELEEEWRALAVALGNPFVTPDWFHAWLRHHQDEAEPAVAVVRGAGGSLRGLLPLVRATSGRPRQLRFGGATLADHLQPVAAPGDLEPVVRAAAKVLDLPSLGASTIVLDNVDPEPPWWQELATGSPRQLISRQVKGAVLPYAEIAGISWEDYLAGRSRNFRRDIKRKLNRLERAHRVEFRRTASAAELESDLSSLYRLHDARWAGGQSTAAGPTTRRVISEFSRSSFEQGWLRLFVLELDGEPVAALLQWMLGKRLSSYYTGFDPRRKKEGVGLLLTAHTLQAAIEEGANQFSMLLGDEPWKERFATARQEVSTVVLVRAHHPARLLVSGEGTARQAIDRLPAGARARVRSLAKPLAHMLPSARRR